jgi:DtxR family Mn-dependent transcriptional regulator
MSISTENFLKTIYQIRNEDYEKASGTRLAEKLNISNAAVTDMAKKLSKQGIIRYKKYKGVELTSKGKDVALKVIRKHRLWELFLSKVLNFSWNQAHKEAEMLEHQTSDFLLEKINHYLDYPDYDPHGDPIPDRDGKIPHPGNEKKLSDCEAGKSFEIIRVNPRSEELAAFFVNNGIHLGRIITISQKLKIDNSLVVEIDKTRMVFNKNITRHIYVIEKK